ncbi:putative 3-hydroxybutyryl-CoA dehydrogenase [Mycosarcoma maydis]|uniref:3-hydroxybutyryl-CoA dehydrogenase n=1 Tax=Mycosarcoma maydis TaxID=5270 RepID=A0A0D1E020_MYCMD|nr:putative 3-hydroxybutyryl-CoA dehydrogenase [Ustilago maydis 521]KIS69569.1 putative 3-hydroxybutyryl-CoA dehydrogenase [Ustilago maydis 521]|eukprot:XP_011388470.1 putative 3-hydroxybutyryl-CoA dehydrogenase [Ustilago maydis 521]
MAATTVAHGVKTLGVVGAGQMGLGIAYVAALRAQIPSVLLCDASPAALEKGVSFFETLLKKDVSKGKIQQADADAARARLITVERLEDFASKGGNGAADMVIEAATENLTTKQKIFGTLASSLPLETILATNTSSISVTKIAASAVGVHVKPGSEEAWKSPARALGIHFFNPVPVMPLVELIPAIQTSADVVDRSRAFAQACGKEVTTSKDVPGFVSNRLLMPFINEAVMALEKGIASKEDIDKTLRLGMNHPMGPLTLADFIGLDTCLSIMETLYRETADSKYRPAVLLGRMVDAGWYGKKSGKGFYDYAAK